MLKDNTNHVIFPMHGEIEVTEEEWPTFDYPLHYHDFFEMEIVSAGKGRQLFNGVPFDLNYRDIYLIKPIDNHQIHSDNIQFSHFAIKEEFIPKWLLTRLSFFKNPVVYHLSEDEYKSFISLYQLLDSQLKKYDKNRISPIENIIELIFILFLQLDKDEKNTIVDSENYTVSKILYFIQKNKKFTEKISLQEIANYIGYSKYYTSSLFHKSYGITIQDYIINQRIEYAKKLILESNYSITEIIMECGFTSPSNFYSKFMKIVGYSPTNFKKINKQGNKEQRNENTAEQELEN